MKWVYTNGRMLHKEEGPIPHDVSYSTIVELEMMNDTAN